MSAYETLQIAIRRGLMCSRSQYINPNAMLPSRIWEVMQPGPNGNVPTGRQTANENEAYVWAVELLREHPNGFGR